MLSARRILLILWLAASASAAAQELEPRRWSHLPVGANFAGLGYAYTDADILFDPALEIEDATAEIHTLVFNYVRVLDVFGKTGRVELLARHSNGRWEGLLEGEPASTERNGFRDPRLRFAVNLLGSPAQRGEEFRQFKVATIVGAALDVTAPLGEYRDERLINLGTNRWSFRPQLGVVHNRGKWAGEVTTSAFFYTDNDDFRGEATREQDPLYAIQAHLIYTYRPGWWASISGAYGTGARSTINGTQANDKTQKSLVAASFGFSINASQGFKLAYVRGDTHSDTGDDFDQFVFAYSMMWGGR
jgi:hypothetical protein